jgi:hypothetical protein
MVGKEGIKFSHWKGIKNDVPLRCYCCGTYRYIPTYVWGGAFFAANTTCKTAQNCPIIRHNV